MSEGRLPGDGRAAGCLSLGGVWGGVRLVGTRPQGRIANTKLASSELLAVVTAERKRPTSFTA